MNESFTSTATQKIPKKKPNTLEVSQGIAKILACQES